MLKWGLQDSFTVEKYFRTYVYNEIVKKFKLLFRHGKINGTMEICTPYICTCKGWLKLKSFEYKEN